MTKADHPAFPTGFQHGVGMTLREFFAALAMQGILSQDAQCQASIKETSDLTGIPVSSLIPQLAIGFATSLIKELNKGGPDE